MPPLILASSSIYRQQLLARLGLTFQSHSPDIDETPIAGETAAQLVLRLAQQKAQTLTGQYEDALIIGSDQVASLGQQILSKPGNHSNALKQLAACSGKTVTFYTGLALLNSTNQQLQSCVEPFSVQFRTLSTQAIERYLQHEQPYDCAGSFKMEGLGISLFERLSGDDPNSLVGLPLIQLVTMLANEGIDVP
ncbi:MAG: MAF protein [Oceanicoccus sp.]|jgi:MAF protein